MSKLSSAGSLLAAMLLLLAAAAAAAGSGPSPLADPPCKKEIDALQTHCLKFVQKEGPKVPPSPECCAAVKRVSSAAMPCVCQYLGSSGAKDNISMDKVFFVTKKCGVTIPGNCGGSKV